MAEVGIATLEKPMQTTPQTPLEGAKIPSQESLVNTINPISSLEPKQPEAPVPLSPTIDEDPSYRAIVGELKSQWINQNGKSTLSPEGQDYAKAKLQSDADRLFTEKYPDRAKAYLEQDKARIYDDFNKDPAIQSTLNAIELEAGSPEFDRFGPAFDRVRSEAWIKFVNQYPEKAKLYAEQGHTEIKRALEDRGVTEPAPTLQSQQQPTIEASPLTPTPSPISEPSQEAVIPPVSNTTPVSEVPQQSQNTDMQEPEANKPEASPTQAVISENIDTSGQKIQELEGKLNKITEENNEVVKSNAELKSQVENLTNEVKGLKDLSQKMLEHMNEQNEEKKKQMWKIILEIAAVAGIALPLEVGKEVNPLKQAT